MSNEKFQNKYRIPSARATWHDYNGGAYFITICTQNREHFFGEIRDGQMRLSEIGKFASGNLNDIADHHSYAEIPLFVVMPNHIHAIVFIDPDRRTNHRTDAACNVSDDDIANVATLAKRDVAGNVSTTNGNATNDVTNGNVTDGEAIAEKNAKMVEIAKHQSLLCVTIRGFKSAVTKFARENEIEFAWQTRFDDRIIRDQNRMNRVAEYIENNVARWDMDCFNE